MIPLDAMSLAFLGLSEIGRITFCLATHLRAIAGYLFHAFNCSLYTT
jgi:hypothetical protein